MIDALRAGFRVDAFLDLHKWKVIEIGTTVPLTESFVCPCDEGPLRPFCTFVSSDGSRRLRVGCCRSCGHVTYIDRPTRAWMDAYYLTVWDGGHLEARSTRRAQKLTSADGAAKTVVSLAMELAIDRRRPVCEIGCGWGESALHLQRAGFSTVIATEASEHRAEAVRRGLGIPVFTGPFESAATQQGLAPLAPFSVIVSNHVLEHTFQPAELFAAAARLQREGDYIIVAVPNQEGEPAMGVLFFLAHLHSFTRASLECVAARQGYALADDSHVRRKQLVMVFRKDAGARPSNPMEDDPLLSLVAGYERQLALDRFHAGLRRLWWERRGGRSGQRWMLGRGPLDERLWAYTIRRRGYREPRSIAIRRLRRRFVPPADSPMEIQFPGAISLFYK